MTIAREGIAKPIRRASPSLAVLLFVFLAVPRIARAAACCGGGIPVPALVLGDEKANVSSTLTYSTVGTDVSASGIWQHRQITEHSQTLRFDTAHVIADRFQIGASLPVVRRVRSEDSRTGLGDVALNGGYEFLPEWDYSPWKPHGLSYLQLTLPTGRSIYEATDVNQLDNTGRGFWALGTGVAFTKVRGPWDGVFLFDVHRSFAKEAKGTVAGDLQLTPGWGGSLTIGAGRSFKDIRAGASLAWIYEDGTEVSGGGLPNGALSRYASAALSLIYAPSRDWSASMSYSDQTLFGTPTNTPLARAISVSYQHRFPR
jgi:hypothetical protein